MSGIGDAKTAAKTALDTIDGLEVYRFIPGSVNPPAAVIWPENGADPVATPDEADARLTIRLLVQDGEAEEAQDTLDELIETAADALATVGGQVVWDNYGQTAWGDLTYWSADLHYDAFV